MIKKERYPHGGFTLIELLVVVLIIGILAAIALPQYQMAVGKTKLIELKSGIKNIYDAEQRYYLVHNSYPTSVDDLDISFDVKSKQTYKPIPDTDEFGYKFTLSNGLSCAIWLSELTCGRYILGQEVRIYSYRDKLKYRLCAVFGGTDPDTKANKLCRKDTGYGTICSTFCYSVY